jgi:hypothetical protein
MMLNLRTAVFRTLLFLLLIDPALSMAQIGRNRQQSEQDESRSDEESQQQNEKSSSSPDTAIVRFYFLNPEAAYSFKYNTAILHGFENYNPLQKSSEFFLHLGNPGSASKQISFRSISFNGFSYIRDAYCPHSYSLDSIIFYEPESPYSEINYIMGRAKEQQLLFTLSQQVRKGLIVGIHARYANSPGLYQRQRDYYSSGYITASYTLPSGRFGLRTAYLNDRLQCYENGGIAFDTVFTDNTESNRKTIDINLANATNRTRNSGIIMQQYFNLQKTSLPEKDSLEQRKTGKFNAGRVIHTLKYNRRTYSYQDNQSSESILNGFYPLTFGDSTLTLDTTCYLHMENNLVYSNIEPDTAERAFPFQYAFGIGYHTDQVGYNRITTQVNLLQTPTLFSKTEKVASRYSLQKYHQWIPFGTLKGIIARKTFFIAKGKISLGGYNSGDHELKGIFYQKLRIGKHNGQISLSVSQSLIHPDYFMNRFLSDHFRWDNSLRPQDIVDANASVDLLGYSANLDYSLITNYTWLNAEIRPEQYSSVLAISRLDLRKVFHPGRWNMDLRVTLQRASNDSILQLPFFVSRSSISYTMLLFKKVLLAEIGIGCFYYSSFYPDAYQPEIRMFYKQNLVRTGNYPYLDAFLNLKIKRARLFFKYEHLNAGLIGYNYYMVPHYPVADASLKVGVSWMFYD